MRLTMKVASSICLAGSKKATSMGVTIATKSSASCEHREAVSERSAACVLHLVLHTRGVSRLEGAPS